MHSVNLGGQLRNRLVLHPVVNGLGLLLPSRSTISRQDRDEGAVTARAVTVWLLDNDFMVKSISRPIC